MTQSLKVPMPEASAFASAKISDIEALRGFAVLFVVSLHIWCFQWLLPPVFHHGWTGVDLFFVISGFVVTRALHRDYEKVGRPVATLVRFYLRRAFRILPALTACVAFWLLGLKFFNQSEAFGKYTNEEIVRQLAAIYLMYANYIKSLNLYHIHIFPVWSLNVEEHFYLLLPMFSLLVKNRRIRIGALAAVVIGIAAVYRPLTTDRFWTYLSYASDMRFDQLAAGVILAELSMAKLNFSGWVKRRICGPKARLAGSLLSYLLVGAMWTMPFLFKDDQMLGLKLGMVISMLIGLASVFLASADLRLLSFNCTPVERFLTYLGARSYGIYLFHIPAQWLTTELGVRLKLLQDLNLVWFASYRFTVFYVVVLLIMVELVYRFIELPALKLSARILKTAFVPSQVPPQPSPQVADRVS